MQEKLGNGFKCFGSLGKSSSILDRDLWEEHFDSLLHFVKDMCQGSKPDTGKFHSYYVGMSVCGSVYENKCMADGLCATAAD